MFRQVRADRRWTGGSRALAGLAAVLMSGGGWWLVTNDLTADEPCRDSSIVRIIAPPLRDEDRARVDFKLDEPDVTDAELDEQGGPELEAQPADGRLLPRGSVVAARRRPRTEPLKLSKPSLADQFELPTVGPPKFRPAPVTSPLELGSPEGSGESEPDSPRVAMQPGARPDPFAPSPAASEAPFAQQSSPGLRFKPPAESNVAAEPALAPSGSNSDDPFAPPMPSEPSELSAPRLIGQPGGLSDQLTSDAPPPPSAGPVPPAQEPPQSMPPAAGAPDMLAMELGAGIKPLSALTTNISIKEGDVPANLAAAPFAREGVVEGRVAVGIQPQEFNWKAASFCHQPLYFEDVNLERYGYSSGYLQPAVSAAHFFATVPLLPYKMVVEPPCDCVYTLGYYRPGSCAPHQCHGLPARLNAAGVEAFTAVGLILLIP